jgi:hypothetical protein
MRLDGRAATSFLPSFLPFFAYAGEREGAFFLSPPASFLCPLGSPGFLFLLYTVPSALYIALGWRCIFITQYRSLVFPDIVRGGAGSLPRTPEWPKLGESNKCESSVDGESKGLIHRGVISRGELTRAVTPSSAYTPSFFLPIHQRYATTTARRDNSSGIDAGAALREMRCLF